jgi:hypothetical protein
MPTNEVKYFPSPLPTDKMKKQHLLVSSKIVHPKTQNSIGNQEATISPHSPKNNNNNLKNKIQRQE